ncbi:MAG: ATP-binding protein [Bacillota bacterium]
MKELSLHILDIVQNSIAANADNIEIVIKEDLEDNLFEIIIEDDGKGMTKKESEKALDPFVTSRTTREVGLGLPFLKKAAENCNGEFLLESESGKGTKIKASFEHNHIDRAPLGNITDTLITLITTNKELDFFYYHLYNNKEFSFSTKEIKEEIDGISINNIEVIHWIKDYINENLSNLRK